MKHAVKEIVLSNGAKGLLIDVPGAEVMSFDIELRAGHYLVEREKWEVPHIMEHMVLGANKRFSDPRKFTAEFEKNGAYSNASTDTNAIHYIVECADFEWDRVLELMLLSVSSAHFDEKVFEAEFGNVRDELYSRNNSEFRRLSLRLSQEAGLLVVDDITRIKLMESVTNQDVVDFYKKTHTTNNIRFIIAGNTAKREKDLIKLLEEGLEDLEPGERFELPEESPKRLDKAFVVEEESIPNMYFFIDSFSAQRFSIKEQNAIAILDTLMTGSLHSLMLGEAREQGLVYFMGSGPMHYKNTSSWYIGAQVTGEKVEALFDVIHDQLKKLLDGDLSDLDVEAAKRHKRGATQLGTQTVGKLAQFYHGAYYFDETIEPYYDFDAALDSISTQDIVDVARKIFKNNNWNFGTLGKCDQAQADKLRAKIQSLWD